MTEVATLAGGCFWCTEAVFQKLNGVQSVASGYSGGHTENPTYEEVCSGNTGHAEAIQITFDPEIISYEKLLDIFWHLHDPTTLNKQVADVGTQYRSAIFYHDKRQKEEALQSIKAHQNMFKDPIVTEVVPFAKFYEAEPYHKDYYERNKSASYCRYVINPKITKLYKDFKEAVKQ